MRTCAAPAAQTPSSFHLENIIEAAECPCLAGRNRVRNSFLANADHWVRMSLSDMIFSGVFERHPKLKVGTVEHELSWIPHFLDRIDYTYTQRVQQERYRFKEAMLPSDYFHRNVFAGFQEDAMGIRDRHIIGVDNLLWARITPTSSQPSRGAGRSSRRFWATAPKRRRPRSPAATLPGSTISTRFPASSPN